MKQQLLFPYTLDEDATWAALTHFTGFAIFVSLAGGSKRWVVITVLASFSFFWMLLLLQVPTRLWSTTTNFLGFAVMLISSMVGLGLFSALAQVLTLVQTIVGAHPELKLEIAGHLDKYPLLMIATTAADVYDEHVKDTEWGLARERERAHERETNKQLTMPLATSEDRPTDRSRCVGGGRAAELKCFLCGRPAENAEACVCVCSAWLSRSQQPGKLTPCTPYASLRDKVVPFSSTLFKRLLKSLCKSLWLHMSLNRHSYMSRFFFFGDGPGGGGGGCHSGAQDTECRAGREQPALA